tara:strand:- start:393 stop:1136 length:744 start_codon:yes stop_codon:yes gene_type:complete
MKIPVYDLVLSEEELLKQENGLLINSLVKNPAMMVKLAYKSDNTIKHTTIEKMDEQGLITTAVLVPDMLTLEFNENGEPFYEKWSKESVRLTALKAMKEKTLYNVDINHDLNVLSQDDVFLTEVWLVDNPKMDKSNTEFFNEQFKQLGYEDGVPEGTLFATYKINSEDLRNKIKAGELTGMSVYGRWAGRYEGDFSINRNYNSELKENDKMKAAQIVAVKIIMSESMNADQKYKKLIELSELTKLVG